jgi:hypothetical protein
VVSLTPRPLYPQEARWAQRPIWTCAKNLAPTGIRSPNRPDRSQSPYRLSYPVDSCTVDIQIFWVNGFDFVNKASSDLFLYRDHPAKSIFACRTGISVHVRHKCVKIYCAKCKIVTVGASGRAVYCVGERPLAYCDRGFEPHHGHGYLSVVCVVR